MEGKCAMKLRAYLARCVISALFGGGAACWLTSPAERDAGSARAADPAYQNLPDPGSNVPSDLTPEELVNVAVYENTNRGVVHITTRAVVQDLFFEKPREGSGSGSVIDRGGHILTNYHVIEEAQRIHVLLFNGQEFEAALVGHDAISDVAVLRIEAPPEVLFPIMPGDSGHLRVGQRVFAIGNPFGLERTMTVGIISSLNRTLPSRHARLMRSMVQIDAALNQGNSGGPLLDSHGRLIGMNTAIASSTGENTGVGFAIPASTITRVVPQLIQNGKVSRPEVGIAYMVQTNLGPAIVATTPGGPAERAGLRGFRVLRRQSRRGPFVYEESRIDRDHADVVKAVDGREIATVDDFMTAIESKRPGQEIALDILREGQLLSIRFTLGAELEGDEQ